MAHKDEVMIDYKLSPTGNDTHPPKFGVIIPNRIFVGGIPSQTQEADLFNYFSTHGAVKDVKIIMDRAGVSKGYGFVTFDSNEDVKKVQQLSDTLIFKERKLNVGPAIKKQQPNPKLYSDPCDNGILNNYPNIGTLFYPQTFGVSHLFYGPTSSLSGAHNTNYPSTTLANPNITLPGMNNVNVPVIPSQNPHGIYLSPTNLYPQFIQPEHLYTNMSSGFLVSPNSSNLISPLLPNGQGNALPNNLNHIVGQSQQMPLPLIYSPQPVYYPIQTNSPGNSPLTPATTSSPINPKWINSASILHAANPQFAYSTDFLHHMNQVFANGNINMQSLIPHTSSNHPAANIPNGVNMHIGKENDAYLYHKASIAQPFLIANNNSSMMSTLSLPMPIDGVKD